MQSSVELPQRIDRISSHLQLTTEISLQKRRQSHHGGDDASSPSSKDG